MNFLVCVHAFTLESYRTERSRAGFSSECSIHQDVLSTANKYEKINSFHAVFLLQEHRCNIIHAADSRISICGS